MIHWWQYFQLAQNCFLMIINALVTLLIILSIIVGTEKRPWGGNPRYYRTFRIIDFILIKYLVFNDVF